MFNPNIKLKNITQNQLKEMDELLKTNKKTFIYLNNTIEKLKDVTKLYNIKIENVHYIHSA
jgi:uncharacterized protein YjgD (DUF1641 family)